MTDFSFSLKEKLGGALVGFNSRRLHHSNFSMTVPSRRNELRPESSPFRFQEDHAQQAFAIALRPATPPLMVTERPLHHFSDFTRPIPMVIIRA